MHISIMLVFWYLVSLVRNSVVLAVYLLFSVACFFTIHEHSKWGGIFTDDQMAAAMIDRLVHHGHLLIFEGKSYRMEHALMRRDA